MCGARLNQVSEQTEDPPQPDLPGYRIGRYLGGGASGMVWAVTRVSDDARLAAKVLLAPVEDAVTEIACLERLEHDHVLRLHDSLLETTSPVPRLAMITDLAEGGSLGSAIAGRGHLTVGELVTVLTPLARTLHDLHGQGLVHGDLSPANVLLDTDGKPLLADFGVARLAAESDPEVWGTDGFVAPEVLAGEPPTPASDVYALGALAWTALVGEAPPPAALRPHLPDLAPQAPAAVCDLVLSCLTHTPEARPDAGRLALTIWDSAAAEPAPRAGSEGARAARSTDPWAGLTQRIRETARQPTAEPERAWHRLPVARRAVMGAGVAGLVAGAFVVWPQQQPVDIRADLVASGAKRPASAATSTPTPRVNSPVVPPRAERTAPRRSTPVTASTARPSKKTGSTTSARAQLKHPRRLVQRLVDARARAWTGDGRHLGRAMVVDSAAWKRDRSDLRRAASAGAAYEGLRFTVRKATVSSAKGKKAVVSAVVDRSRYRVVGSATASASARDGQRVTLTLSHTSKGWRIADWAAP